MAPPVPGALALYSEHVDEPDIRILREQLWACRGKRCGDLTREVGLARRLVLEGVEDPERGLVDLEAVPDPRARLLLDDRLATLDERLDVRFLAGLRLDEGEDPQRERHAVLLVREMRSARAGGVRLEDATSRARRRSTF